jgi:hypothetical protein
MNVVFDSADRDRGRSDVSSDTADKGPRASLKVGGNAAVTVFRRKDAVNAHRDAIMAHGCRI